MLTTFEAFKARWLDMCLVSTARTSRLKATAQLRDHFHVAANWIFTARVRATRRAQRLADKTQLPLRTASFYSELEQRRQTLVADAEVFERGTARILLDEHVLYAVALRSCQYRLPVDGPGPNGREVLR